MARLVTRARPAGGRGGSTAPVPAPATATASGPAPVAGEAHMAAAPGAAVVQRLADVGKHPSPPPAPGPVDPHGDPRFTQVTAKVAGTAKTLRAHPPAKGEASKASAAAVAPPDDKAAQAKAAQADKLAAAKPAGFDKAKFMAAVRSAIAAKAPHNLDEADHFAESGKADGIKAEVMGQVTAGKAASAQDISDKTNAAPDTSVAKPKPVTPLAPEPAPGAAVPATGAAMPAKAPAEQTDLAAPKAETDAQMAEADVTEEQLARSNEPEFTEALAAKKAGEAHSDTAPAQVRQNEAATLAGATQGATQSGHAAVAGMTAAKSAVLSKVAGDKGGAKSKDDAAYQEAAAAINKIFDATQLDVRKILSDLDTSVATRFDEGEKAAKAAFTADHKARMERYKDERYSGLLGKGRWLKDKFAGLPAEANNLFLESRKLYEARMETVISAVADHIGQELGRAKDRIAQGRQQIADYVKSRPAALQKIAQKAAGDIGNRFDKLESEVDEKQDALVEDLAQRYADARNAVDEEIKELQAENRGLWDKAKDAIGGAIKTILKLKDLLLGVLARAAGAIGKILKDPVGFLGKLVNAVKSGVQNFASNIYEHLKKGLQGWLFGALGDAGIDLPDTFDLKGIIRLVLSILGLTWMGIRTKIVRRIGEAAMGAVEKGVDIFQTLAKEGVGGLWRFLIDKLGDLKDTVMGAIQDFVVFKIVKAGITWLISALNPAAAFIKACKMIYDVVMFFVEKGSQIKEFVDSVLDSIESIAGGGVGGVARRIEDTLSRILPLLLGFLASLLGLGGMSEKIKEIFDKVRAPVEKAVDVVINGALKLARPIIDLAKRGAAWVKGRFEKGKAWVKGKVEGAKTWAKGKIDTAKGRLGLGPRGPGADGSPPAPATQDGQPRPVKTPLGMYGAPHELTASYESGHVRVTLASPSARELLGCVANEIQTQQGLADQTTGEEKAYHQGACDALRAFRADYDAAVAQIRAGPPNQIEAQLRVLNATLAGKISAIAARHKLKDFVLQTWDVRGHLDSIRAQVRDQLEKHLHEPTSVGDGHANTATAAELALGWVHESDQRHVEKTSTVAAALEVELAALDEVQKMGVVDLSGEEWYVKGKRSLKDCRSALTNPRAYLKAKGCEHAFIEDIRRQRRLGRTRVGNPDIK